LQISIFGFGFLQSVNEFLEFVETWGFMILFAVSLEMDLNIFSL